ncbi:MAG: MOSC domain-containing protein [Rhizobiales bacterium]|nr:MOSC domain-containing protein [Hyphomicrobiales bacterium]
MTSQSGDDGNNINQEQISVHSLHRYPVKGLSAEDLDTVTVETGQCFPYDRAYAIENGPSRFNAKDPKFLPKINFLALMKHERLARLDTKFEAETETLTIFREGRQVAKGNLSTSIGRNMIEQFIAAFMKEELKGPPKLQSAPNHHFADCPEPLVHIITTASAKALEVILNDKVDLKRFRSNIVLETTTPWMEKQWVGKIIKIGEVEIEIIDETSRCAAINVDLETGQRGRSIPATLTQHFNNENFGVYGKIIKGGELKVNDTALILS